MNKGNDLENSVGPLLRQLRREKGLSVEQVAFHARMAPSTLYRWESGDTVPRLTELFAVLDVLKVSTTNRRRILLTVQAPRAVIHLREKEAEGVSLLAEWSAWMPTTGDLWKALRMRRKMSAREVAERLRIDPSAVTRWEKSQRPPPEDRIENLLKLFNAYPNERAYLGTHRLWIVSPSDEGANALHAYEEALHDLHHKIGSVAFMPADLLFITLEGKIWPLAGKNRKALRLLALAYIYHANFLMWSERLTEMICYVERAQAIVDRLGERVPFQFTLTELAAHYVWRTDQRRGARRALKIFSDNGEFAENSASSSTYYRTMAEYANSATLTEEALSWIHKSQRAALQYEDYGALRLGNIIHARIMLQANRAAEAVSLLALDDNLPPHQHIFEQLLWAETLRVLGDKTGATTWLNRFYSLVDQYNIEHQRWQGEEIERRLENASRH